MSALPPAVGWIHVYLRIVEMTYATFYVDGHPYQPRPPGGVFTVAPGRHVVRVEMRDDLVAPGSEWFPSDYGSVSLEVDVAPGQIVPIHYTAPLWLYGRGALGIGPQRRRWSPDPREALGCLGVTLVLVLIGLLMEYFG